MLMPKRVKHRKQFRGSMRGKALRGNTIANGLMGALITSSGGMVNCFKVPLICGIVMLIFGFMFKDVKKGETL